LINRIVLVIIAIILLAPAYFMLTGSVQDLHGIFMMPPKLIPRNVTLQNYKWIFTLPVYRWFMNTIFIVGVGTAISVFMSVAAGYVFAFYKLPFKEVLWVLLLIGIMVPYMSIVVPRFVVVRKLGIAGTLWAAILPAAYQPQSLFIARMYFRSVPTSIMESARIDGAGDLRVLMNIIVPISRPIVTACGLFAALMLQGDYLWQMLQLRETSRHTLLIGLMKNLQSTGGNQEMQINPIGQSFAVAAVLFLPLLAVFLVANKYFTSAIAGAVKE